MLSGAQALIWESCQSTCRRWCWVAHSWAWLNSVPRPQPAKAFRRLCRWVGAMWRGSNKPTGHRRLQLVMLRQRSAISGCQPAAPCLQEQLAVKASITEKDFPKLVQLQVSLLSLLGLVFQRAPRIGRVPAAKATAPVAQLLC